MKHSWQALFTTGLLSFFTFVFLGCDEDSVGPSTGGRISLSVKYSSSQSLPKLGSSSLSGVAAVDSIEVTRARFLIRSIKFDSALEDSLDFRSDPLVVELDLGGSVTTVGVVDAPLGTYKRIRFRVHRLDPTDPEEQPFVSLPEFQDFMQDDRYSIIVEGTVFGPQGPVAFNFRSRDDEDQRYEVNPPLVLGSEGQEVNVTLVVNSANWFRALDGSLLDPTDVINEDQISDNLEASIEAVKDDDKDGEGD